MILFSIDWLYLALAPFHHTFVLALLFRTLTEHRCSLFLRPPISSPASPSRVPSPALEPSHPSRFLRYETLLCGHSCVPGLSPPP